MGILKRVMDMTRAATNEMLDKVEKPGMMLNQYLRDMDEQIIDLENAITVQKTQERMAKNKLQDLYPQVKYYEEKAEKAVAEGRETDARLALEAKLLYSQQMEELNKQQQLAENSVSELESSLENLKEEKLRLQAKKGELMTRLNHTGKPKHDTPSYGIYGAASQGFERIEQKIMEWEAHRAVTKPDHGPHSSYSQELRNNQVEEELQRLIQKQNQEESAQT